MKIYVYAEAEGGANILSQDALDISIFEKIKAIGPITNIPPKFITGLSSV